MKSKKEKKEEHYYEYLFLLFATIVFLDRITKTFLGNGCYSVFCIEKAVNSGAAFGILPGMTWFFIAIAAIILASVLLFINEFSGTGKLALVFIAAGTAANMIDRVFFSHVIDIFSVFGSSAFNLADLSNTIGGIMLVVLILKGNVLYKNKKKI